jgi:hypothetical protein
MLTHALYVPLEAKPDHAEELQTFLREAHVLAEQETGTAAWFALRVGPITFAIFDAIPGEQSRQARLDGEIAQALMGRADELLAEAPQIHPIDVIVSKL